MEDFYRMRKIWVGQVFGSALVKSKAWVLILIHKNLLCEIISVNEDDVGRLLTLHMRIYNKTQSSPTIMPPTPPNKTFFQTVSSHLSSYLHVPLMVGGDFNSVLHAMEDKSLGQPKPPTHSTSPGPLQQPLWKPSSVLISGNQPTQKAGNIFFTPHHTILCPELTTYYAVLHFCLSYPNRHPRDCDLRSRPHIHPPR